MIAPLRAAIDESEYGGKAASLARALGAGLPVPPGLALSWQDAAAVAAGDQQACAEVVAAYRELGGAVSVRSSAIGEDSAASSFAGQHLTLLNVSGEAALLKAIGEVVASATTDAAQIYRQRLGVSGESRIGVVLQRMVDSDCAGVLFTRNPVTGAEEHVVEAAWGLGEVVVAGLVTPDRYRLSTSGDVVEITPGLKDLEIRLTSDGTAELDVAPDRVREVVLNGQKLRQLHELAVKCQQFFGPDIDLEWAFEGDRLFLLQSRPITIIAARPPAPPAELPPTAAPSSRRLTGFALAAILSPLNSTMIAVALPAIGLSFGASASTLTLALVSLYLVISILAQSPAGRLADVFGYSRVLTAGRVTFALGAVLGSFAPSMTVLTLARVLMAIGGAMNIPPVLAELRNSVAPDRRGRLFGFFGATMGTAAAAGPLLGDLLIRNFGWHSVFLVNLPLILLSLILEPPQPRTGDARRRINFDFIGSLLFALSITLIVGGAQIGSWRGWAGAACGLLAGVIFVAYERRRDEPLLDPSLFAIRSFTAGSSIVALQNFTMYAVLFLVPFLLSTQGRKHGAGAYLLAMTGAMVVASPLGGRLADSMGESAIALIGALVGTAGAAMFILVPPGATISLCVALALLGAGIGFSTSPSQSAALSAVPRQTAGSAAGALSTMRYLGGVLGTGVVSVIVATAGGIPPLIWIFPAALLGSAFLAPLLRRQT